MKLLVLHPIFLGNFSSENVVEGWDFRSSKLLGKRMHFPISKLFLPPLQSIKSIGVCAVPESW